MLADLDETIRRLLKAELPIRNGEIDIAFDQPKREWSARLNKPTINFFLYDVRQNPSLRTHNLRRQPNGNLSTATLKRTPIRVDCTYMITTWATEAEDEHRLLTRTLMTLWRFPILSEPFLVDSLQDPPFDIQTQVAVHDRLTNPAEIWGSLDNEIRPSIPYIVTLALDPWQEITGPAVREFALRIGRADNLPFTQELAPDGVATEMYAIGGAVQDKDGVPQAGIEVALRGTGHMTTTDAQGRFTFGHLPAGKYTLLAWPSKGRPKQKTFNLPGDGTPYEIEL